MPPSQPIAPARRRGRKLLLALGLLLVVLIALVALAPTLINMGLGRSAILAAINQQINGTAAIGNLSLGWFSPQRVDDLVIRDAAGKEAANLDLSVNAGLLKLALGKADPIDVSIAGVLTGEIRGDASTSFAELLAKPAPASPPGQPSSPSPASPTPGAARTPSPPPAVNLTISKLTLNLYDTVRQQTVTLQDLSGNVSVSSQRDILAKLTGATSAGDLAGSIGLAVDVKGFLRPAGATAAAPTADINVEIRRMPVMLTDRGEIIESLSLTVTSADLTRDAQVTAAADISIPGSEPGRLDANLTLDQPLAADGSPAVSIENIRGQIAAKSVPTALLQLALAGTGVIAERDIGRTVDVTVSFGDPASVPVAGSAAPMARRIVLSVAGERLKLAGNAEIDLSADTLRASEVHLVTALQPGLLDALAHIEADKALTVDLKIDAFSLPAVKKFDRAALQRIAASGSLAVTGDSTLQWPAKEGQPPQSFAFGGLSARFDSPALAERITTSGTATIEQSPIEFDETVVGLFQPDGSIDAAAINPTGTVKISGLQAATLKRLAPGQAELIDAAITGPINIAIQTTSPQPGRLSAAVKAAGPGLDADVALLRGPQSLTIGPARVALTITPQLARTLQKDRPKPIMLAAASQARLAVEAIEFSAATAGGYDFSRGQVAATLAVDDAALIDVPSLVESVGLHGLQVTINTSLADQSTISANYQADITRPALGALVAKVTGTATIARGAENRLQSAVADVTSLSVLELEHLLGREPQSLAELIGATGSLSAVVTPQKGGGYHATIDSKLSQLTGKFAATTSNDILTLTAEKPQLTLRQPSLQRMLNPAGAAPTQGGSQPQPPSVLVEGDMTLTPAIRTFRWPIGATFDPAAVNLDVALAGTPLRLRHATPPGMQTSLSDLAVAVRSSDLRQGIEFTLNANAESSSAPGKPSPVEVRGNLTKLVAADGKLALAQSSLELTAKATGIATAIADALGQMNGLLVDAIGPQMNATATAVGFSANSGTLEADLQATNGWLRGKGQGRDHSLRISPEAPVTAELQITPPLRERLLYKIHPVLADIRTTKQPLRATITAESIPLDGNVSRLNADIEITIGEVEIDGGSTTLFVLSVFNQAKGKNISGYIEPIRAKIRNGLVTYDRFAVKIDKYLMVYSGKVDLNTKQVDLRTEVPADALAKTFHELEGLVDGAVVPITTRGVFGKLKTEPDFGGLVEQVIPKLIEKGLSDLLKKLPE